MLPPHARNEGGAELHAKPSHRDVPKHLAAYAATHAACGFEEEEGRVGEGGRGAGGGGEGEVLRQEGRRGGDACHPSADDQHRPAHIRTEVLLGT